MVLTLAKLLDMASDPYINGREWAVEGNCWDSTSVDFFPPNMTKLAIHRAKQVCSTCPVREPCLGYALLTRQIGGIWGGRDLDERQRIVRRIQKAGYRID